MLKFESKQVLLKESSKNVYEFLTDLRNFNNLIKEYEISDWKSDKDYCEFKISNFGKISLKIFEAKPYELVNYTTTSGSFINFKLKVFLQNNNIDKAESKLILEADIPFFLQPLVKDHLQKLLNVVVETMENFDFKN